MATKKNSALNYNGEIPVSLKGQPFFGIKLDPEQEEAVDAIWNDDNDIIFINAVAGTGKTLIATGTAEILHGYGKFENIIYIMSPCSDRQGFLPGTITEKSSVYFEAFYQALVKIGIDPRRVISDESMVNQKYGTGYIQCITDTYLRGSNFENAVLILDESQNFPVSELKKTLTRACDSTKVIVIGHDKQCDLNDKSKSGFTKYIEHFRGKERCAICSLTTNHRGWVSQWADELEE